MRLTHSRPGLIHLRPGLIHLNQSHSSEIRCAQPQIDHDTPPHLFRSSHPFVQTASPIQADCLTRLCGLCRLIFRSKRSTSRRLCGLCKLSSCLERSTLCRSCRSCRLCELSSRPENSIMVGSKENGSNRDD